MSALIIGIYISPEATKLPVSVNVTSAVANRGLSGDRYFNGCGTFSNWTPAGPGRELTLIESEVLDELELPAADARRNLITKGIALNGLVGKRFRIGEVLIEGIRLCPPCAHLEKVTGLALMDSLAGRGGLRANILSDGELRVGGEIEICPE